MTENRWLLLAHQLPASRSNERVKIWRRLQQLGAVPIRNSVYALPNTEQCREDFEWLRSQIVELGGQATVFSANAISDGGAEHIVSTFEQSRAKEYAAVTRAIGRLELSVRRRRGKRGPDMEPLRRAVQKLRDQLAAIERVDFFRDQAHDAAETRIAALEQLLRNRARSAPSSTDIDAAGFQNRRWVTRPRPGVDRMASAWLIRRFIDRGATFIFADAPAAHDVAFDMYTGTGGFGHRGGLCTFEVLAERFKLSHPAVTYLAHIVHDLDLKESKYAPPEAPAVERMVEGLRALYAEDSALLEQGIQMFEALARSLESPAASKPTPPARSRRK